MKHGSFLLRMRNVLDKSCVENTHILCSMISFPKFYLLWDNVDKYRTAGACVLHAGQLKLQKLSQNM